MSAYFIDSVQGAGGLGDGSSWANAYLTLAAAFSGKAAGDTFWVGDDHAETQTTAITLNSPGTIASPCFVYCVDHTKVSPATGDLKTTATISTTTGANITLCSTSNYTYYYGVTFKPGDGANAASLFFGNTNSNFLLAMESCGFTLNNTSASSKFTFGGATSGPGQRVRCKGCTFTFGSNTSQTISALTQDCMFEMFGGSFAVGASVPTNVFSSTPPIAYLDGVDLSAFGAGKTLIAAGSIGGLTQLRDCKLGAATVAATPTTQLQRIDLVRSDSAGTNYRSERYVYAGTQTAETTIIRTGGASDGATGVSWKIATTANSKWVLPFEAIDLVIWNDTTGANRTVTVYGTWNSGSLPNNDDIWVDVEYLGSAASPLGSVATATKANNLATGAALTADGSSWGGGGSGVGWSPFSIAVTLSAPQPAQKGYFRITVKAAKASSTFYIDPDPILS